jgi:hypothetical protein
MKVLNLLAVRARQTTFMFHGIDLVVLFAICPQGYSANPFFPLEACALLQREPVKVADRIVVASGIHHHLQRMCTRG